MDLRSRTKFRLYLLLVLMLASTWIFPSGHASAAGSIISDQWRETSSIQMIFFWNLEARRDGKYGEGEWPEAQLTAADTFLFGLRQAYLDMDITGHIAENHDNRVWIEINNTITNFPDIHHERQLYDYPPHINVHLPWREPRWNDTNGHFYTGTDGKVVGLKYNYTTGACPTGEQHVAPGSWTGKRDSNCDVVYEERFTTEGELQLRINEESPIYTLRNKDVSDLDILRGDELLYNIQRTFFDASIAKMVWQITDYQQGRIINETFIAEPDTGQIISRTAEEQAMDLSHTPQLVAPAHGSTELPHAPILEIAATGATGEPLEVTFYGRQTGRAATPFTFVVIPDTQHYTESDAGAARFTAQMEWIVGQQESMNIVFASHVGDIVEHGGADLAEWQRASAAMAVLDQAGVPNGLVTGNHDLDIANDGTTDFLVFDQYFPPSRYAGFDWYGGYQGDPNDGVNDFGMDRQNKNSYQFFTASGMEFLVLHLEMDVPEYAIDWAAAVLAKYPDKRVILTTHAFINSEGNRRYSPDTRKQVGTSSDFLWRRLIYPNCNIFLVLNGHYPRDARRTDPNLCGAPVHQVIQNYQGRPNGGNGWLRYFVFQPAENQIKAYTYSPLLEQFEESDSSRFSLAYEMESDGHFQNLGTVTVDTGESAALQWPNLAPDATYEWYAVARDGVRHARSATWGFTTTAASIGVADDSYTTEQDEPLTIAAPGVLANDPISDDGIAIRALLVSGPEGGAVMLQEDGSFIYTPADGFSGRDQFTYRVEGAEVDDVATVYIDVLADNTQPPSDPNPVNAQHHLFLPHLFR
jgi:hypothetical protein